MKNSIDDSVRLFEALVVLLLLNCVWVTITTVIHAAVSLEGLISSSRLLVSVLLAYAIHRHLTARAIGDGLFWIAAINSAIVAMQLFDAQSDHVYLPNWLRYGSLYGFDDIELWRKGGLVPSLQTSSLLATYGIFFGIWRGSRRVMIVVFPLLAVAILVGARTFVPLGLIGLVLMFIRMPVVTTAWLWVLGWTLSSAGGFLAFFELRFGPLFDVFLGFDFSADYSAQHTLQSYRELSLVELFVGNGEARYSDVGGKDPFYTRWLYQSGAPSLLLLLAVLAVIGASCGRYSFIAYLALAVAYYHNIKAELFTSTGTFDALILLAFIFLQGRGSNLAGRMPSKSDNTRRARL